MREDRHPRTCNLKTVRRVHHPPIRLKKKLGALVCLPLPGSCSPRHLPTPTRQPARINTKSRSPPPLPCLHLLLQAQPHHSHSPCGPIPVHLVKAPCLSCKTLSLLLHTPASPRSVLSLVARISPTCTIFLPHNSYKIQTYTGSIISCIKYGWAGDLSQFEFDNAAPDSIPSGGNAERGRRLRTNYHVRPHASSTATAGIHNTAGQVFLKGWN
jgi:hypothetical protein